jgi:aspartyl protease family protein
MPPRASPSPPQGGATIGSAKPVPRWPWQLPLYFALFGAAAASAQSVALQGMMGAKALLIVDGAAPKTVAPGDAHRGVKVISTSGDEAVVEIAGKRHLLRVGDAPASVGGGGIVRGNRIVLTAGTGGHFTTQGTINGQAVRFLVDTGATSIALGAPEAERIGLNYKSGQPAWGSTANGTVAIWHVKLSSVRIGDVEIYDVDASVLPAGMPYVLLGNSFLGRFQMRRDNDQMVLERRY